MRTKNVFAFVLVIFLPMFSYSGNLNFSEEVSFRMEHETDNIRTHLLRIKENILGNSKLESRAEIRVLHLISIIVEQSKLDASFDAGLATANFEKILHNTLEISNGGVILEEHVNVAVSALCPIYPFC